MEKRVPGPAKVIDFDGFKARRASRLPLFDDEAQAEPEALRSPTPVRALSSREVEHRQRMLKFATGCQALCVR